MVIGEYILHDSFKYDKSTITRKCQTIQITDKSKSIKNNRSINFEPYSDIELKTMY